MESITYLSSVIECWYYPVIAIALGVVVYAIVRTLLLILNRRHLKLRDMVWLEITPPASIAKTPEATEQLFSVIHGGRSALTFREKMLGRAPVMSFEIVSTKQQGIRYLVQVERERSGLLQKIVTSYIPDAKVKEVTHNTQRPDSVVELKQTSHYVLPLTMTTVFEQHDPLAYITGAMTKLESDEQITLQMVVQPVRLREASILSHKIMGNENILQHVQNMRLSGFGKVMRGVTNVANGMTSLTGEMYMGTMYGHKTMHDSKQRQLQVQTMAFKGNKPSRSISAFEQELMLSMHKKVTQPLFRVNLRILVTSTRPKEHISTLRAAIDGFSMPPYQALRARAKVPALTRVRTLHARSRLPSLTQKGGLVLSSSELAGLYHFPSSQISKTDNLITSLSRTLAAPVSLKSGRTLSVLLGENRHHGTITPIGLTAAERERHVYVIGGTGNGKTTLLMHSIVQDIQNGQGVAVVDPHGDLADTLLRYIPEERIKDVIYMNPDDLSYPIGMNLLELPKGLEGDDLLREKDIITESTISVLRKIFSEDDSGGHRIEYVLRNTIQTALTLEGATLFTIFELLNNPTYRRDVLKTLEDENLKNFWKNELGKAGDFQRVKMVAGITAKIGRFLFSGSAKRVLEQEKSTINFDEILDEGKILICNFSKGILGEDTSTLFGTTVLAKLQLASLRRARYAAASRRPYYLYVDEFQNFATISFVQMLSEARKYKLFLTMAEQSTSQQDQQRLVDIILANVGTVICFRSGSPADERLVLPLFSPYIEQGEISNLPAYSFYSRIAAVNSQEPMSGVTVLLDNPGSGNVARRVIDSSRHTYAKYMNPAETHTQKKIDVPAHTNFETKLRRRKTSSKTNQPTVNGKVSVKSIKPVNAR